MPYDDDVHVDAEKTVFVKQLKSIINNNDPEQQKEWMDQLLASKERSKQYTNTNLQSLQIAESMKKSFIYFCENYFKEVDDDGDEIPPFPFSEDHQEVFNDRVRLYFIKKAEITGGKGTVKGKVTTGTMCNWRNVFLGIIIEHYKHKRKVLDRILKGGEYSDGICFVLGQVVGHICESMSLDRLRMEPEYFGLAELIVMIDYLNVKMTEESCTPHSVIQDLCALQLAMLLGIRNGSICKMRGHKETHPEKNFSFYRPFDLDDQGNVKTSSNMFGVKCVFQIFKGYMSADSTGRNRTFNLDPVKKAS